MKVTISDIARLANVSKAAVSAVINDKPGISEETRERVKYYMKQMNYRPSEVARSLSNRSTRSIGLVIKEIDNPYFAKIMKGVFDFCSGEDYTVLLGSSELSPKKERKSIETLVSQRVEGLIISPLQGDDVDFTYLSDLIRERYPLVLLGNVRNYAASIVEIDNSKAAYMGTSRLIELGHREIAYFMGPTHSQHSADRLEGYKEALILNGIPFRDEFLIQAGSYIENGYAAGKDLFTGNRAHPTAVLCYNDLVAIGLINALIEAGKRVPADVSVIGFDNIDIGSSVRVPLTTINVPAHEIGVAAARLLIGRIGGELQDSPRQIILEAEIIERSSAGARE